MLNGYNEIEDKPECAGEADDHFVICEHNKAIVAVEFGEPRNAIVKEQKEQANRGIDERKSSEDKRGAVDGMVQDAALVHENGSFIALCALAKIRCLA